MILVFDRKDYKLILTITENKFTVYIEKTPIYDLLKYHHRVSQLDFKISVINDFYHLINSELYDTNPNQPLMNKSRVYKTDDEYYFLQNSPLLTNHLYGLLRRPLYDFHYICNDLQRKYRDDYEANKYMHFDRKYNIVSRIGNNGSSICYQNYPEEILDKQKIMSYGHTFYIDLDEIPLVDGFINETYIYHAYEYLQYMSFDFERIIGSIINRLNKDDKFTKKVQFMVFRHKLKLMRTLTCCDVGRHILEFIYI